jgi:hypothetical protein
MLTSQGNSQTLLNDTTCIVPCSTLKNALILKSNYNLKEVELRVTRDSNLILTKIVNTQDTLINKQRYALELKDTIISLKNQTIIEKDKLNVDLKKDNDKLKRDNKSVTIFLLIMVTIFAVL